MADAKRLRVDPLAPPPTNKPWIEKYRPQSLSDVQAQEEAVAALRSCLSAASNMPHFLFYGPPGTGKTSAILAVAKDLFGPDYFHTRVKEMNASDDRGIQVVREKIKTFAHGAVGNVVNKTQSDGKVYPVPPFKLIILDEADALLPDAQAALRRMMEDFSDVTRFCILCNYLSRIIDPISSRCAKFRFKPLSKETLAARLALVARNEGVIVSDFSLGRLQEVCGGDLRLAIMYLQSAAKASNLNDLTNEDFVAVAGEVSTAALSKYISALLSGNLDVAIAATLDIARQGFSANAVVRQLQKYIVSSECNLSSAARGALCIKICEVEKRLIDRGDDLIQLMDLSASFVAVCTRKN